MFIVLCCIPIIAPILFAIKFDSHETEAEWNSTPTNSTSSSLMGQVSTSTVFEIVESSITLVEVKVTSMLITVTRTTSLEMVATRAARVTSLAVPSVRFFQTVAPAVSVS
jgi:hypothetical protein